MPSRAIASAARLLARARTSGAAIFHIAHKGRAGGLFDRDGRTRRDRRRAGAACQAKPVIEKGLPNAFAGTDLQAQLAATGRKDIMLAGFMTHMCISSTARAALDLGFRITVDADSCATRDLPDGRGGSARRRPFTKSRWPNCRTGLRSSPRKRRLTC